jgi:hypothetical protein
MMRVTMREDLRIKTPVTTVQADRALNVHHAEKIVA